MRTPRPRGFTLIELLVTMAISSVILAAAVSVFITMATQQRTAERLVEAQSSTLVALTTMQMDVGNAGYRFPVSAFAVRHIEVDSATSLPSVGTTTITTSANCDTGGLVEGTDVLELAEGYPFVGPGKASAASVTGGSDVSFTLGNFSEPFATSEATGGTSASGVDSVLAFTNAAGSACLVRVTSLQRTGVTDGLGKLIDRDHATTSSTFYPGCPAMNMDVYRLGARVRYMICKPSAGATPNQYSLYRQTAGTTGLWGVAPTKLQEGIEDLQVSVGYSNASGAIASTGTSPTCIQGSTSASSFCFCDDKPSGACSLTTADVEPGLTSITGTSRVSLVKAIRIQLTGMGQRLAVAPGGAASTAYRRPDSFDHAGMTTSAVDSYLRVQQQFSFAFQNLQVVP